MALFMMFTLMHFYKTFRTETSEKSAENVSLRMFLLSQNIEFLWDVGESLQQQGFSIEPSKGFIEPGRKEMITITWTPYSGYKVKSGLIVTLYETRV